MSKKARNRIAGETRPRSEADRCFRAEEGGSVTVLLFTVLVFAVLVFAVLVFTGHIFTGHIFTGRVITVQVLSD